MPNMPTKKTAPPAQKKELGGKAGLKKTVMGNPKTAPHGNKGAIKELDARLSAKDRARRG